MYKAAKYRIYPTTDQKQFFAKSFGCCRKIWNLMLSDLCESYEKTGKFVYKTPAAYKDEYPYLKEVDSLALANKQLDLKEAVKARFDKTRKKNTNFPKYKSAKHSKKSYTTNNQNGTIAIVGDKIKLPKVGFIKAVIHMTLPEGSIIKNATISQDPDGKYYCSVAYTYEKEITPVPVFSFAFAPDRVIGLDYKSDGLYADSNGNIGSEHKYFRESQKKLAKAQRSLSCKKKGSKNYEKQKLKVAKIHKHTANQRKDNLHKTSTEITNQYDVVCVENLDMQSIANKGFRNGKSTMDNAYGMFLSMLKYKMEEKGKYFVVVDKWYPSSQICSCCGKRHKMPLSQRVYKCECGLVMDRDHNSAINIKQEGLRILLKAS